MFSKSRRKANNREKGEKKLVRLVNFSEGAAPNRFRQIGVVVDLCASRSNKELTETNCDNDSP